MEKAVAKCNRLDPNTDPEGAIMVSGLMAGISVGSEQDSPSPGVGCRFLPITDPDGDQVVFFGE
ncbi:hypothetical protein [Brevibacterium sp. 2SA]|uniref:hypothetical protein n=1 Tax=Brevibacterium sp. 2SA TaxID=2502198 RepID=UPI0010F4DAA7|nr:hypothetical protein [Brevibacterium sp. 2SA]